MNHIYLKCLDNINNLYKMKVLSIEDGYFTLEDKKGYLYKASQSTIFYGYKINIFGNNDLCNYNLNKFLEENIPHLKHLSGDCSSEKSDVVLECSNCQLTFKTNYNDIKRNLGKCESHSPKIINKKKSKDRIVESNNFSIDYPEIAEEWNYDKNGKIIYSYSLHSKKKYWWKCNECGHEWETSLRNRLYFKTGCLRCSRNKTDSNIEKEVFSFLKSFGYTILREKDCTLYVVNPKTNRRMFYDNEIYELRLIIEVHGDQHYSPKNGIHRFEASRKGVTYEDAWKELKDRDDFKKEFCIDSGYNYLEISDKDIRSGKYKKIILDKITEINDLAF